MKVRSVLLAAFGLLLAIVAGRAVVVVVSFRDALGEYDAQVRRHARAEDALARAGRVAVDLQTGLRGWALTREPHFLEPYERATAELGPALEGLEQVAADGPEGRAAVARVRAGLEAWQERVARPVLAAGEGAAAEGARGLHAEGKRRMDAVRADLDALRARLAASRADEAASVRAFERRFELEVLATNALTAALMVAVGLFVRRNVEAPLALLARHAEGRAGGAELANVRGVSEVRSLARALDEMARRTREELERGRRFAEFAAELSAGGGVAEVADAALRGLAREAGAAAGVLWVRREPDGALEPAAHLAFDPAALAPGGGALAREVARAGEARRLDGDGPGGFHLVRSALGDAAPLSLYAAPLRAGGAVVGVVELAGGPPAGGLERHAARAGVALQNAVSQERAEALRRELVAAGEELRLQNEELLARQDELRARGGELAARQAELAQRNEDLVRASRAKSDFLSTMSHELRTPLNAVIGFAEVLLEGAYGELPGPQQRAAVADIRDAGRQLLALVNDVLDLAKIEAGRLDVRPGPVDAAAAIAEACALLETQARRKGVRLAGEPPAAPLACVADRDRLRQVLVNLASNAVKFTPAGGAVVVRAAGDGARVRFDVRDTGVGIAPEEQAQLFRPFAQAESGRAGRNVGTGLGLSISKRLVELMGGSIGLASEGPGRGATFFFALPRAAAPAERRPATDAPPPPAAGDRAAAHAAHAAPTPFRAPPPTRPGPRRTVLVVDDDPMHARVAESVLARGGYDVAREPSAEAALARLGRERPDLVIVDLGLPGLSGTALLETLRARPELKRLPAVVLTARDLSADEARDLARLADLVTQKGVMTDAGFLSGLDDVLARPRGASVLVVDDNEANRRVVRALTAPAGYHVVEAESAEAGLALARRERPDVVLMDVRMPDVDGLEATRRLRADEATRDIPVVAVSAQAMIGDRERALDAGCIAYVTKPIARAELFAALELALGAPPSAGATPPR